MTTTPAFSMGGKKLVSLSDFDAATLFGPAVKFVAANVHDTTLLTNGPCRGLWVGVAGSADMTQLDGTEVASVPLLAGYNPFVVKRIKATNLTASAIWAIY